MKIHTDNNNQYNNCINILIFEERGKFYWIYAGSVRSFPKKLYSKGPEWTEL